MPIKKEVVIGDCRLLLGDCLEIMPTLGKVDACVCDPPYGIGAARYERANTKHGKSLAKCNDYGSSEWDSQTSDSAVHLAISIAENSIIFGGNYYDLPPTSCWLVWDKENGENHYADCELAWTNLDKAVRRLKHMWHGMLRKGGEERVGHPTQKPVGVMEWCINHLPKNAETILDPFMGSGTTGVACAKLGRKFVGIELEERYFDIACERISKAYDQPDMFVAPVAKPEQVALGI